MVHHPVAWPEPEALTQLVRQAHHGAPGAVDDLLATLRPPLLAFFVARVADDGAEDLVQIALLRLAGALPRIDPERADAYVGTVARNVLRTAYRRLTIERRRRAPAAALADVAAARLPADRRVEYEELARAVHRVSATALPPVLADLIAQLLRGETTGDIAARQGVSPTTIRTRLFRARAILRDRLQGYVELLPPTSAIHNRIPDRIGTPIADRSARAGRRRPAC